MDIGKVIEIGERKIEVPDWEKLVPQAPPAVPAEREVEPVDAFGEKIA